MPGATSPAGRVAAAGARTARRTVSERVKRTAGTTGAVSADAGDAIDAALAAPNKQLTVAYWQKVFGSTFQA